MRELRIAAIAAVVMTVVLGVAYPLAMTGVAQVLFPSSPTARGQADGKTVGSKRIGQDFSKNKGYFQSRPSVTDYNPSATFFNNQGPNQQDLADQLKGYVKAYLKRERPYTPNLHGGAVPPDAVTTSASGVDPQISEDNARIQANRVASERNLPLDRVTPIIDDHTSRPLFGLGGPKSVNVLEAQPRAG